MKNKVNWQLIPKIKLQQNVDDYDNGIEIKLKMWIEINLEGSADSIDRNKSETQWRGIWRLSLKTPRVVWIWREDSIFFSFFGEILFSKVNELLYLHFMRNLVVITEASKRERVCKWRGCFPHHQKKLNWKVKTEVQH